MKVITVVNNVNNVNYNLLKLSCIVNDLELVTLISNRRNFYTRRIKDHLLDDFLSSGILEDDEIIFFTDGTDALFTCGESEIINKYNSFDRDVVFSAETGCWPDKGLATKYPLTSNKSTPYKYLNSGGFIGKAGVIKKMLKDNDFDMDNFPESNQYIWTNRYFKYLDKIGLDTSCLLFCTFSPELGEELLDETNSGSFSKYYVHKKKWFYETFTFEGNRLINNITNTKPCHLHFNGQSKLLIESGIYDMVYKNLRQPIPPVYYCEDE